MRDLGSPLDPQPSYALHRAYLIAHRPANVGPDLAAADVDFLEHEGCLLTDEEFHEATPEQRDRYAPKPPPPPT